MNNESRAGVKGLSMADKEGSRTVEVSGSASAQSSAAGRLTVVRSVPESLAAEAAVLGSMIIDPECISEVVELIGAGAFYRLEHRYIFEALVSLWEKHGLTQTEVSGSTSNVQRSTFNVQGIDAVLLRDELQKRKQLEAVGGVEYIARIMDSVPSSANVGYYAGIVKDKMLLRELIAAAGGILDDAYNQNGDTPELLDEAERRIFAVTDKSISGSAMALKDVVTRSFELITKRQGSHITGLATGYYQLDEWTCGLQNGEMIIVAGRPSMGKTSLALNIAEHLALTPPHVPVAIFSLEMGRQQIAERFLCSVSQIDSQKVRKGLLGDEDYKMLADACAELSEAPVYIDDTSTLTPLELRAKARRLKSQYDIRCCFVDYLQLMHIGERRVESRQQEITEISRYVKALARELNIPVVVMSQLNRAPEGREDHRPRMSDLRESGSIEQDADVVILLHREDYYHRGQTDYEPDNRAELIIAKQRNGPTANVELVFRERVTRFENAAQVGEPASGVVPF
jgi:replicative DNA helicase